MNKIIQGDCLNLMAQMEDDSVDLVFTSPPYEDARQYGKLGFHLKGQKWVDWAVPRFIQCLHVCTGLVAWVVQGRTRQGKWSCTPALLMADLHRAGVNLRNPPIFHRSGIPGSGGPQWLRSDYEWIICASPWSKLPWSDNTAMGEAPKYGPGGDCTNRKQDGTRVQTRKRYKPPKQANPGNVISCTVGGGKMGSPEAHKGVAPFPEKLAKFFIRSFCPPGGIVLDPFSGSGTTAAVAAKTGRHYVAMDLDPQMVKLTKERLSID